MNRDEKMEIIGDILLAIAALKDAEGDGLTEEQQELLWRDIEDGLNAVAFGREPEDE